METIPDFYEAVHTLINTFIYDPICQGRIHHTNPLNVTCGHYKRTEKNYFSYFQQLLHIPGIDVNAYDALYESNTWHSRKDTDNRQAPIHHLANDYYADKEDDERAVLFLKELLSHNADINLKTTQNKYTPLHYAPVK